MNTRTLVSTAMRLLAAAAISVSSAACGGELLRTGRSPVYLVVTQVEAQQGTGQFFAFLLSDVLTGGGTVNDNARVTLRIEPKNPTIETTAINTVTMTGYRVDFKRSDGQNRPGIDVPYGISGGLSHQVAAGATSTVSFVIVRHQAKEESPLKQIGGHGGVAHLTTTAEITLYGRDQNGNELMATAFMDVHFADFADEE